MPDPGLIQSPRSASFSQQPDPSDEEGMFVQGFSDLAYKALGKVQPGLMEQVVTFRVLEKDVQNGEAVGTFIVKHTGQILFIPVVLVDNNVKPLDMFYCRARDRYYPLNADWLRDIGSSAVSRMGMSVDPPKTLSTDVDIRSLVVPPTTGRYSYAEAEKNAAVKLSEGDWWLPFSRLKRTLPARGPVFLDGLSKLSNETKRSVGRSLKLMPKVAELLVEQYGVSAIKGALALKTEKVASVAETPMRHDVYLATASTPLQEMQRELSPGEVASAYGQIRKHGFYIADRREKHNELSGLSETTLKLEDPKTPGLWRLYMTDGKARVALVIPNPKNVHRKRGDEDQMRHGRYARNQMNKERVGNYLILFPDGKFALTQQLLAEPVAASQDEVDAFIEARAKKAPSSAGYGVLISQRHLSTTATMPEYASKITSSGDRTTFNLAGCHTVTKVKGRLGSLVQPTDSDAILMGDDYVWWPLDESRMMESDFLMSAKQIWTLIEAGAEKTGSLRVIAKATPEGNYLLGYNRVPADPVRALVKVATAYGLTIADASCVLTAAKARSPITFFAKKAEGEEANGPPMEEEMPPQDPNAPPPGGPGIPQAPPPPPSGLELAVAEQMQLLDAQIQALQQQQQVLMSVQQRAMGIDGGGGGMASPQGMTASMGMPPAQVNGQPQMAPVPGPGGDPNAQMGPPPQGMPPQGPPGMPPPGGPPGMPPPGGPPGMPPPGMDPNAPPPAPPPVMSEAPSPDTIASQISPAFLNDASVLNDPQVFDAAAVASFAKPKAIAEIFANYGATLDEAVDKLGRALLLLYTQTRDIRQKLGDEAHRTLEQRIRDVFQGLGAALIMLNGSGSQLSPLHSPSA